MSKGPTLKHLLAAALIALVSIAQAKDTYPPVDVLLQTSKSILGERLEYPQGTPQITMAIVTMQPGQVTGLHEHDVPLMAYILDGEITVDYGAAGSKSYRTGDALVEAFRSPHSGTNTGEDIVRILAVFAGAEGVKNTVVTED